MPRDGQPADRPRRRRPRGALVYFLFFRKKALPEGKAPGHGECAATDKKQGRAAAAKGRHLGPSAEAADPRVAAVRGRCPPDESRAPPRDRRAADGGRPPVASKKDVAGLRKGLAATRGGFMARLKALFTGKKEIDPAILEQIEEVMISSDVGVKTTQAILERLREQARRRTSSPTPTRSGPRSAPRPTRILDVGPARAHHATRSTSRSVVLMVGVNGVGKTTTIGKLATKWNADGKKVILAAGDTFRAAAVQQLEVWGKRVGAEVVQGQRGRRSGRRRLRGHQEGRRKPAPTSSSSTPQAAFTRR